MAEEKDKTTELEEEARLLRMEEGDPEESVRKVKITIYAAVQSMYKLSEIESMIREALEDSDAFVGIEDVTVDEK